MSSASNDPTFQRLWARLLLWYCAAIASFLTPVTSWGSTALPAMEIGFEHYLSGSAALDQDNINAVTSIVQDDTGYMWFGGENGLARFDGNRFDVFQKDSLNSRSLSSNYVWDIAIDRHNVLWVATGQGINRFDGTTRSFVRYNSLSSGPAIQRGAELSVDVVFCLAVGSDDSLYLGTSEGLFHFNPKRTAFKRVEQLGVQYIRDVLVDEDGRLWVGTSEQGLYLFDPISKTMTQWLHDPADPGSIPQNYVRAIERDAAGNLWIGTLGGGVARMDASMRKFTTYVHDPDDDGSIGSDSIWDIHRDQDGNLWIATDPGGLALYSERDDRFYMYRHSPFELTSLSSDKVRVIYDDALGDLWVGTFPSGVNYFNKSTAYFRNFEPHPNKPNSLSHENVTTFFEDSEQRIWIGTEGGLNEFNPLTSSFTHYLADDGNPKALQANAVLAIEEDELGFLWVGTWAGGLHQFDKSQGTFTHYGTKEPGRQKIADDYIWSLLLDSQKRFWVGTENSGLLFRESNSSTFRQFKTDDQDPESLSFRHVWALLEDSQQRIWVGTINGLDLLIEVTEERARFRHFRHDPTNVKTLSSNRIISLLEDQEGLIWVGTQDSGVNRLDPETGEVMRIGVAQGLPSNHISSLLQDDRGYIWMTTVNGVAMLHPETMEIRLFSESSGLVSDNFNRDASYKDPHGLLYFGGSKGFSVASPGRFFEPAPIPKVVISDFKLFNKSVINQADSLALLNTIEETKRIELSYRDTMFSFEFFAVNYRAPKRNQYAYKLEGFDKQWNMVGGQNSATYTNLDPGKYVFKVRAANSDGIWNNDGPAVEVVITGPFWQSAWAYVLYFLILLCLALLGIYIQRSKLLYQNQKLMAEKLLKVDRLKDAFLANTSHELRTPLNGIIGLAETLHEGALGDLSAEVKNSLRMISSSGRRLSNLINDILDYSKLNEHKLQLRKTPVLLHKHVESVIELLKPLVGNKSLQLINDVDNAVWVSADDNRLQQILLNIMGNAIKFSSEGHVRVSAKQHREQIQIAVQDTGAGIAPKDMQSIFSAFTQLDDDDSREQGGTGLGLAITKQLVELHGGSIRVESEVGRGSTFYINLEKAEPESELQPSVDHAPTENNHPEKLNPIVTSENDDAIVLLKPGDKGDNYTILIVDDDAINRMVLTSMLAIQHYRVVEASSGSEALDILAGEHQIDLVIMDVMMPKISGYEACMRIRVNYPVHALPILFLTAKNYSDDLVRGFVAGGNDFLTKPISKHELLSRVSTHLCLLDINRKLEEKYREAAYANLNNNKELRTLEHIVEIINREMDFKVLLNALLQDVKELTEADEIIYWQADQKDPNHIVLGSDLEGMSELCLHDGDLITELLDTKHRNGQSILILEHVAGSEFQFVAETFPGCVSSVLMTIYFERAVVGFITLLSFHEDKRFTDDAVAMLKRIHAHVTSAVIKAKLLERLGVNGIDGPAGDVSKD